MRTFGRLGFDAKRYQAIFVLTLDMKLHLFVGLWLKLRFHGFLWVTCFILFSPSHVCSTSVKGLQRLFLALSPHQIGLDGFQFALQIKARLFRHIQSLTESNPNVPTVENHVHSVRISRLCDLENRFFVKDLKELILPSIQLNNHTNYISYQKNATNSQGLLLNSMRFFHNLQDVQERLQFHSETARWSPNHACVSFNWPLQGGSR